MIDLQSHSYYVFSTGTSFKARNFRTRKEAEASMNEYCVSNNISVECYEQDKHERAYTNHKGVRFYINRV